ncbi:MAG: hypothetical protein JO246_14610 [Frankiaceae bacterium]|nr:hypothetical protein [Frankiaceae bacterium]MBV9872574.1 hypothetical protein [Frankiaceae bacterium]
MALWDVVVGGAIGAASPTLLFGLQALERRGDARRQRLEKKQDLRFEAAKVFYAQANLIASTVPHSNETRPAMYQAITAAHADLAIYCPELEREHGAAVYVASIGILSGKPTGEDGKAVGLAISQYRDALVRTFRIERIEIVGAAPAAPVISQEYGGSGRA